MHRTTHRGTDEKDDVDILTGSASEGRGTEAHTGKAERARRGLKPKANG